MSKGRIKYLGKNFYYDNPVLPFSLMAYPLEVKTQILEYIKPENLTSVLDIGGNIGQFATTLSYLVKNNVYIDIFEPNNEIFGLLCKNTANYENMNVYNYAIGRSSDSILYFTPGKSAIGSLKPRNAVNTNDDSIQKTKIRMIQNIKKITNKDKYDLVKIDVEGYEFEVMKYIVMERPDYIYLELSTDNRDSDYCTSQIFDIIAQRFGEFNLLFCEEVNKSTKAYNILLKFNTFA